MSNSTQNKCPFCNSELISLVLPSNPPQYKTHCPNCENSKVSNSTQKNEIKQMEKAINEGFAESEKDLKNEKTPFDKPTQNDNETLDSKFSIPNDELYTKQELDKAVADARREVITGETSDGYHTFNELYEFRKLFNALLFNEWAKQGLYDVHKSIRHSDGEKCFGGGWFIVMAKTPEGQISNHYEMKDWDLFKVQQKVKADKWDGHTAQDVLKTLSVLATLREEESHG